MRGRSFTTSSPALALTVAGDAVCIRGRKWVDVGVIGVGPVGGGGTEDDDVALQAPDDAVLLADKFGHPHHLCGCLRRLLLGLLNADPKLLGVDPPKPPGLRLCFGK